MINWNGIFRKMQARCSKWKYENSSKIRSQYKKANLWQIRAEWYLGAETALPWYSWRRSSSCLTGRTNHDHFNFHDSYPIMPKINAELFSLSQTLRRHPIHDHLPMQSNIHKGDRGLVTWHVWQHRGGRILRGGKNDHKQSKINKKWHKPGLGQYRTDSPPTGGQRLPQVFQLL